MYPSAYSGYGGTANNDDAYEMEGGRNPTPQYQGQCIVGENGYPLISARVHRRGRSYRSDTLQWRHAEVECGLAMDGGLQDVVLHAAFAAGPTQNTVYVDDAIMTQADHMGAIKTALQGAFPGRVFKFANIKDGEPPDGAIVVHLTTAAAAKGVFVPSQPTKTNLFYTLQNAVRVQNTGYSWPSLGNRGIAVSRSRY